MGKPFSRELSQLQDTLRWAGEQNVDTLRNFLFINPCKPLVCIGSGGAYSACRLASILHRNYCSVATSLTPLGLMESKTMWISYHRKLLYISAGGKNVDIVSAYKKSAMFCKADVCNLSMRLGNPLETIAKERDLPSCNYDLPTKKDGFLATNSLVAFFTILVKTYFWNIDVDSIIQTQINIEHTAYIMPDNTHLSELQHFTILYSEQGEPVAYDMESKLSEAALGAVQLSDYRNFGHGRHHWFDKRRKDTCIIALVTDKIEQLVKKTLENMPSDIPIIYIRSHLDDYLATIDLLIKSFYFIRDLGEARYIDPGRPGVPDYGSRLYNMRYLSLLPKKPKNESIRDIAIARKCRVSDVHILTSDVFEFYFKSYVRFVERLNSATFSTIAFDYDGTLCRDDEESRNSEYLDSKVCSALLGLLKHDIHVAIVTGRGSSVVKVLMNSIPSSFRHLIVVGLYNGMYVSNLSECNLAEVESIKSSPLHEDIAKLKEELWKLCPYEKKEIKEQRDMMAIKTIYTEEIYELCLEIIKRHNLSQLNVWQSSHSMDVVVRSVSKNNIKSVCKGNVLYVGDSGIVFGNDFEMLTNVFSLSCDRVSRTPDTCWNLAPENLRGLDATLYYVKNLKLSIGTFKCHFEV